MQITPRITMVGIRPMLTLAQIKYVTTQSYFCISATPFDEPEQTKHFNLFHICNICVAGSFPSIILLCAAGQSKFFPSTKIPRCNRWYIKCRTRKSQVCPKESDQGSAQDARRLNTTICFICAAICMNPRKAVKHEISLPVSKYYFHLLLFC